MKETIAKTTPRSFSMLFLLASVPAFYFINELFEREYSDPQYTNNSNRFYKYYYLYNMAFFGCGLCLAKFNFHTPTSLHTMVKTPLTSAFVPLMLTFIGMMLPETDSKHQIWPALITQLGTMTVEGNMANRGMLTFWFYSHRHYVGLFFFVMFVINYNAMSRQAKRRKSHPHEFVDLERN